MDPVRPSLPAPDAPHPSKLLPPLLLGPAAFLWFWALPIGVQFALNFQAYQLIEGNLNVTQRTDALFLGGANLINLLIGVA
jgi:hypothetical protein